MTRITLIAAVAENGVIGNQGEIPWRVPGEMAHFKATTLGHTLIMGRKTFESIGRVLPGRRTIVLPEAVISRLFDEVAAFPGYRLTIDLPRQVVVRPQGEEIPFEVQPFRKECLLNGWDDIGLTLRQKDKIAAFEAQRLATKPWLAHSV